MSRLRHQKIQVERRAALSTLDKKLTTEMTEEEAVKFYRERSRQRSDRMYQMRRDRGISEMLGESRPDEPDSLSEQAYYRRERKAMKAMDRQERRNRQYRLGKLERQEQQELLDRLKQLGPLPLTGVQQEEPQQTMPKENQTSKPK